MRKFRPRPVPYPLEHLAAFTVLFLLGFICASRGAGPFQFPGE